MKIISTSLVGIVFVALSMFGLPAAAQTPDGEDVCIEETGAGKGLCLAYIAMGCNSPDTETSVRGCSRVAERYVQLTGNEVPPWAPSYTIGDTGPAGGIVFYITDGGLHGLEAAPADSPLSQWGCSGTFIDGTDTAIETGSQNTDLIVAGCAESGIAAKVANDYALNGYTDWFLPSRDELNELYDNKDVVGGFATLAYWSSSENGSGNAWLQTFDTGYQNYSNKANARGVRSVRAF